VVNIFAMSKIVVDDPPLTGDERMGLPSASGLYRLALCPGSHKMSQKAPPESTSPAAERGTRVHERMEGGDIELSPEEELVAKEMEEFDTVLLDTCDTLIREVRLWYQWDDGDRLFSGKLDVGGIDKVNGDTVLVNYKTGLGQEAVAGNWQAMAESLLFHRYLGTPGKNIVYSFNQPESLHGKAISATFTEGDLAAFEKKILSVVAASRADNPPLMPSMEACKWCKAISICPAASWKVEDSAGELDKPLAELTPENRSAVLHRVREAAAMAEGIWNQRKAEARELLSNSSASIPGYGLKKGRRIHKLTDAKQAFDLSNSLGIPEEDFFGACSISYSKYRTLTSRAAKALDGEEFMEQNLGDVITVTSAADSIIKKKQ
jgi:hypothetical protein